MTILGIDPGIASTGYGLIDVRRSDTSLVSHGVIATPSGMEHVLRLKSIYGEVTDIIERYNPDVVALEAIYQSKNLKSLADVSEAIGVISLAAGNSGLRVVRFTPFKVKSTIVGYGRANKEQVQLMVSNFLNLEGPVKPHHAADALAIAVCYRNLFC